MFTVATWNLENLGRPGMDGGPTTAAAYEAKLASLAATIERIDPDVLAVQEVLAPPALEDLRAHLTGEWHVAISPDADGRGIRVGFLARQRLRDVQRIRTFPQGIAPVRLDDAGTTTRQLGRGALRVRVTLDGTDVDLVTCHLKSKLLHYPGGRFNAHDEGERARYAGYALALRAAEAITVRAETTKRLDGHGGERPLIVLGDLNDEALAATTLILVGPPGSELGTAGFARADQGDGDRLWNVAAEIPEAHRSSRNYNGRAELIDHILVSRALAAHVDSADTGTAFDALPAISDDRAARRDAPASDHAPVVARFTLA